MTMVNGKSRREEAREYVQGVLDNLFPGDFRVWLNEDYVNIVEVEWRHPKRWTEPTNVWFQAKSFQFSASPSDLARSATFEEMVSQLVFHLAGLRETRRRGR